MEIFTSLDTDGISERSCTITVFRRPMTLWYSSSLTDWPLMMRAWIAAQSRKASARL